MNKEFKQLGKENDKIRAKIDKILLKGFSSIDDDYGDIWEKIDLLIENEIAQESYCNG